MNSLLALYRHEVPTAGARNFVFVSLKESRIWVI